MCWPCDHTLAPFLVFSFLLYEICYIKPEGLQGFGKKSKKEKEKKNNHRNVFNVKVNNLQQNLFIYPTEDCCQGYLGDNPHHHPQKIHGTLMLLLLDRSSNNNDEEEDEEEEELVSISITIILTIIM